MKMKKSLPTIGALKLPTALGPLQAKWRAMPPREQTLVRLALTLVTLALIWWVAFSPAVGTLREAQAQQRTLATDIEKMQRLRAQAQAIQSQPKMGRSESIRALETLVKQRLGSSAQLSVIGDRATVTLRGTSADDLAQWLSQARVNARVVPGEARLVRGTVRPDGSATWDGTLLLSLTPQ